MTPETIEETTEGGLPIRDLFCALETMLRQKPGDGTYPLGTFYVPYVWYHYSQKIWWLSTERGSVAIGTFEQAVTALFHSQNDERIRAGKEPE